MLRLGLRPESNRTGTNAPLARQETGAFEPVEGELLNAIGGKDRFLQTSWSTGGGEGKTPTSIRRPSCTNV